MHNNGKYSAIVAFAALVAAPTLLAAPPADWSKIPVKTVKLFYPGQSSYDWLTGEEHKKGANKAVAKGEACLSCHEG